LANVVVVILIAGLLIVIDKGLVAVVLLLSVTLKVSAFVTTVVGVPEITPPALSVKPAGNVPALTVQLYGAVPPVTVNVWE
jgi:hypothetical protein